MHHINSISCKRNCPRHLILSLHTLHALLNEHGCLLNAVPLQQAAQYHKVLLEAKAVRLFFLGFDLVFFFATAFVRGALATSDRSLCAVGYHTVINKFIYFNYLLDVTELPCTYSNKLSPYVLDCQFPSTAPVPGSCPPKHGRLTPAMGLIRNMDTNRKKLTRKLWQKCLLNQTAFFCLLLSLF